MEKRGAKSKLTDETLVKLKHAAAMDASVAEMAYLCGVSRQTIYTWLKENPELSDEIDRLRAYPVLKARENVMKELEHGKDYNKSMDFLKRKRRKEFGDNVDHTSGGEKINISFDNAFDETTRSTEEGSSE